MLTSYYLKIPRRIRILIIFFVIMLAAYFVARFLFAETRNVPDDFLKARQQASLVARDIVNISDDSTSKIDQIAKLDEERNYTGALVLVTEELQKNRTARGKAVELSNNLELMAENLSKISPISFGQKALEAVSSETTLISHLIAYNDYLNQLLDILRQKFSGRTQGDGIPDLVKKLNNEAKTINDLNQKFNDIMKEFDA
ncbi:MAG: hypothetical protein NTW60_02910 [Candidatus Wolfebacteria bacterium]|nr:hypothetical protein [Candidatus Wolfebacteria bacterium]